MKSTVEDVEGHGEDQESLTCRFPPRPSMSSTVDLLAGVSRSNRLTITAACQIMPNDIT